MPPRTLGELAKAIGATLIGDGSVAVYGVAHPAAAGETDLALAVEDAAAAALASSRARAAVVSAGREDALARLAGGLAVTRPRYAMAGLLRLFARPPSVEPGIHPAAVVASGARIGDGARIGALAYVGPGAEVGDGTIVMPQATVGAEARVGRDCLVHPGVRIGERVSIGDRCILHPNACIGADGFSFATPEAGSIESVRNSEVGAQNTVIARIDSLGTVVLGDDVEIGASSTVDRSTLGATRIGRGTKIDNLVQIAHNCSVGENCLIAGHCGLSGSVRLGDRVVLAGGVGVADHLTIGDDAIVMAGSGVGRDVPARTVVGGYPALPREQVLDQILYTGRLKRMFRDLMDARKRLAAIERLLAPDGSKP
jgi:UDP-3-O-[3-hydroxymyristoyl] glucosamine N-acyltransferase